MYITWEDRRGRGKIDDLTIKEKPSFSFEYAWFLVTDETAQYVESHTYGYWNKDMTEEQRSEVISFYNAWEPEVVAPPPPPDIVKDADILSNEIQIAKQTVDTYRNERFSEGVDFDFAGTPDKIQVRGEDRANILGVILAAEKNIAAGNMSHITNFRSSSNVTYQLTQDQVLLLGQAALLGIDAIYQESWVLKDTLDQIKNDWVEGDDLEVAKQTIDSTIASVVTYLNQRSA